MCQGLIKAYTHHISKVFTKKTPNSCKTLFRMPFERWETQMLGDHHHILNQFHKYIGVVFTMC